MFSVITCKKDTNLELFHHGWLLVGVVSSVSLQVPVPKSLES